MPHILAKMASRPSSLIENFHFTSCLSTFRGGPLYAPPQNFERNGLRRDFDYFKTFKIFILRCVLALSRFAILLTPPFLRTKTPPTRHRLLQSLQDLHFTMCLSTFRGGPLIGQRLRRDIDYFKTFKICILLSV